jgi:hypothetical protein
MDNLSKSQIRRIAIQKGQPMPDLNDGPVIQELVMKDFEGRLALGIERYGTGLQAFNGRDMLLDAYEEALDLAVYLRGLIYERDLK